MDYLADTVTIIRHFSGVGRIGSRAKGILEGVEKGEHHLFLSTVSLVEILYLSENNRINVNLGESLDMIETSSNYSIIDLTAQIVQFAEKIEFPDIFDRLIIATAQSLKVPLITSDREIRNAAFIKSIWT